MTDLEKRAARERVVEQLQAAHRELVQMYKRQFNGQPAIRWSIPSKKADSDVIVGDALRDAIALLKEDSQELADADSTNTDSAEVQI
jgi:hypothetical protein